MKLFRKKQKRASLTHVAGDMDVQIADVLVSVKSGDIFVSRVPEVKSLQVISLKEDDEEEADDEADEDED